MWQQNVSKILFKLTVCLIYSWVPTLRYRAWLLLSYHDYILVLVVILDKMNWSSNMGIKINMYFYPAKDFLFLRNVGVELSVIGFSSEFSSGSIKRFLGMDKRSRKLKSNLFLLVNANFENSNSRQLLKT